MQQDTRRHSPTPSNNFGESEFVARIRELLRNGTVDTAARQVDDALARAPNDAEALYMQGVIANRRRDHKLAIAALRRALEIRPDAALAWLALGNAYARAGDLVAAADSYREVVAREPRWADAHFNLGLMLSRQRDPMAAARAFRSAWAAYPMQFEAAKQYVTSVAQLVRNGHRATLQTIDVADARKPSVTIVFCSIDPAKQARTFALYERLFENVPHEIIAIRSPRSLADAYNSAVAASVADVVVLSHDDIDVLTDDFAARLLARLDHCDAVGVVGTTRLSGPAIGWSGHPHLRGWITHRAPGDPAWRVDLLHPARCAVDIVALDGVFIAARRDALAAVPFDAATFDGFHLYDIDWSYRAANAGFRLAVAGDLLLVHASRGQYGDAWQRYADRFCVKHGVGATPPAESSFFSATLDDAEQVRSFFAVIAQLDNSQ